MKSIFELVLFEINLLLKHKLTRPILLYIGGALLLVTLNLFVFNSISNALPWAILFISGINIAYAPLMFSWEIRKYSNELSAYSKLSIIVAKWLFIVIYVIVTTGVIYLFFISSWKVVNNIILSHSIFLIGVLSFIDILYACKNIDFLDIDYNKGYRRYLNFWRWIIIFLPIILFAICCIIGVFEESLLNKYYILLYGTGAVGILVSPFVFYLIKKRFIGFPKI